MHCIHCNVIQLNSLLLSLTLIGANISNSKFDPVLIRHWKSQDEWKLCGVNYFFGKWFDVNQQIIGLPLLNCIQSAAFSEQIQLILAREIQRLEKVQIRGTVTKKYKLSSEGRVEFGAVGLGRGAGSVRGGRGGKDFDHLHLFLLIALGIGETTRGGAVRGGGGSQPAGQAGGTTSPDN